MTTLTAIAWLDDDLERMSVLREILDTMTAGERSRLNSPISARQRVEAVLKARAGGTEEKLRASPLAREKEKNMELARQLAYAEERLAAAETGGSLFDLKRDTIADIADAIIGNIPASKAKSIASAILDKLKRVQKPAG